MVRSVMAKARHHANTNRPKEQHRGGRPTWEGHLRLSLVTCPVALYTATERAADVHFNMINPKTNNRIRMQAVDAGTGRVVERAELVRGFAVSKNKYVLFDKDELDAVKLESTRIIDIEEFVDAASIARKSKGEKLVTSEVPEEEDKVVDLMEALRKSLKGGGGPSREKADRFLEAHARKAKPKAKRARK